MPSRKVYDMPARLLMPHFTLHTSQSTPAPAPALSYRKFDAKNNNHNLVYVRTPSISPPPGLDPSHMAELVIQHYWEILLSSRAWLARSRCPEGLPVRCIGIERIQFLSCACTPAATPMQTVRCSSVAKTCAVHNLAPNVIPV